MINDILDYAALNQNLLSLAPNKYPISQIYEHFKNLFEDDIKSKNLNFEFINSLEDKDPYINNDVKRL